MDTTTSKQAPKVTANDIQWARGVLDANPSLTEERGPGYDEAVSALATECATIGAARFAIAYDLRLPIYRRDWVDLQAARERWTDARYRAEIGKLESRPLDRDMIADVYRALLVKLAELREWYRFAEHYLALKPDSLYQHLARRTIGAKFKQINEAMRVSECEMRTVAQYVRDLDERQRRPVLVSDGGFSLAIWATQSLLESVDEEWLECAFAAAANPGDQGPIVIGPEHMLPAGEKFMQVAPPERMPLSFQDCITALQDEFEIADAAYKAALASATVKESTIAHKATSHSLYQDGDLWQVRFNGRTKALSRSVGFALIRVLLLNPDRSYSARELELAARGIAPGLSDAKGEPVTDTEGHQSLQHAIENQRRLANDASADEETRSAAASVCSKLEAHARSCFFAGRPKPLDQATTRARNRVYRNIGTAMRTIRSSHKEAHAFLVAQIDRGGVYRYRPPPDVEWEI